VIVVVPVATPVTTPELRLTVATAVLLLVHAPNPVPLSAIVPPGQTFEGPLNVDELTVAVVVLVQPFVNAYVIIDVPPVIPVTTPDADPTDAIEVLPLLQTPLGVVLDRVEVPLVQIAVLPVIAAGDAFTVTLAETVPMPTVYVMSAVPEVTPVTRPVCDPTVATEVLLLVHAPPSVMFDNCVVPPASHSVLVPVIEASGSFLNTESV
jgi:hypothetical protein